MADLKQILLTIRSGGLRYVLDIVHYTLIKDRLHRVYHSGRSPQPIQLPGGLEQAVQRVAGGDFYFKNAHLEVKFLAPDIVRISWEPGSPPPPYALIWYQNVEPEIAYHQDPQSVTLDSASLRLVLAPDGGVSFFYTDGRLLRQELPPRREGKAWTSSFIPAPQEFLYGLGLHSGPLNLRSRPHRLWPCDAGGNYDAGHDPLYMPLPVYMGLHTNGSYLVFYENSHQALFTPDSALMDRQEVEMRFEDGMLRYYFIAGEPHTLLERFTSLTGRAPLPPLWSLGYHQSRWGYKDEQEICTIVAGFQEHNLPISAIHLDLDHIDDGRTFSFHPKRFPDVPGFTRRLSEQGIRLVTIIDPGVKMDPQFDLYTSGMQLNAFCRLPNVQPLEGVLWVGRCLYPDFTDPAVRAWWGSFYPRLLQQGVRGFWHDMNEPTSFVAWGEHTLPLSTQHKLDGSPGDHLQGRSLYGFQMNRSGYEALRKYSPELRPWILSRSGWVGSQRFAWAWTADSSTQWESMRSNLVSTLSLGLCGFAYSGPDIGGFSGNPTAELYLRWFQMSAFMPFFRTHCSIGMAPREPWVFGEPYTSMIRGILNLRYRLLPYFYTLAWEHTQNGAPIVRPLFWLDWQASQLWDADDAFLLGNALLVAPAFEPGANKRVVVLPSGEWFDFWSDAPLTPVDSPTTTIQLAAPLERIPILVRAGSILPMYEEEFRPGVNQQQGATLSLHLYPAHSPRSGYGTLYSDAGDGYGPSRLDSFTLTWEGERLLLVWETQGEYPFPYGNLALHLHGYTIKQAWVDGEYFPVENLLRITQKFERLLIEIG